MGSAGSINRGQSDGLIGAEHLKAAFDRNRDTLSPLFFNNTTSESGEGEIEFSDNMIYENASLLNWLLDDIAMDRMKQLGDVGFINNNAESTELFCDLLDCPEIITPIEVDADDLDAAANESVACDCQRYALIAECLGIVDLNFYDHTTTIENPFNSKAVAINISNNQLNNVAFEKSTLSQSNSILQLNMGGNSLTSLPKLPLNLLFLDLSYSDEIKLNCGVFTVCPQLLRLVLDGCGLKSTLICNDGEEKSPYSSLFVGLVKIKELSLKENSISDMEGLKGLEYFSFKDTSSSVTPLSMTLTSIHLSDNPVVESTAERKTVNEYIVENIPSVTLIDGKPVVSGENSTPLVINKATAAYKQLHPVVTDNDMITETMAQEFSAALKGEQDNTVVR